jgi:choline dehydrogenase-like flavoprotein
MGLPATHRRIAQLSRPLLGRPACHFCGACGQGCDIGAMFNSVVSTLPPAQATGRMTLRPDSIVRAVLLGDDGKAAGVSYIDRLTRQDYEARGKVVILAASCLENSRILLNSAPGGIGNSSGVLGRYIMDQFSGGGVNGFLPQLRGQQPRNTDGKNSGMFIPVFRNIKERHPKFIRGYCMSATGGQTPFPRYALSTPGYGKDFKTHVRDYSMAQARVWLSAGEMLPRYENRVEIDPEVKDAWGIPVLKITCTHSDNELAMFADASEMMKEVLEKAGGEILSSGGNISTPGGLFHEVGGCRMGSDPKTSVVDPFCRMHDVRNVYVFSGSPFVTTGPHHPTLTMMALTARGCDHLVDQFKQGNV